MQDPGSPLRGTVTITLGAATSGSANLRTSTASSTMT